jgi:hypothetical protein
MDKTIQIIRMIGNSPDDLNLISKGMTPSHIEQIKKIKGMDDATLAKLTPDNPEAFMAILNSLQDQHLKDEMVDDILGINGGHPIKVPEGDEGMSDKYEYNNWKSGDKYKPELSVQILSNHNNLQPYQVDHVVKHGCPDEKYAVFGNKGVDEGVRRSMYDMWKSGKNGYNPADLNARTLSKLNHLDYYDGKIANSLDRETQTFPYEQYLQDNVGNDELLGKSKDDCMGEHLDGMDWVIKSQETGEPVFDLKMNKELHPSYEKRNIEAESHYEKLLKEAKEAFNEKHHNKYMDIIGNKVKESVIKEIMDSLGNIHKDESILPFSSKEEVCKGEDSEDLGDGIVRHYKKVSLPKDGSGDKVIPILKALGAEHGRNFPMFGYFDYDKNNNQVKEERSLLNPAIQSILHKQKRYVLSKAVGSVIKGNHGWVKKTLKKCYPDVKLNKTESESPKPSIDHNTIKLLAILETLKNNKDAIKSVKETNPEALSSLVSLIENIELMLDADRG